MAFKFENLKVWKQAIRLSGEIHALMGENGAGTSTLMKVMTGLHAQDEGTIVIDGETRQFKHPKEAEASGIAFIHQERFY